MWSTGRPRPGCARWRRVNVVSPGPIETEIFKRGASPEQIEAVRAALGGVVPMKRMGEPDEVARAVLFLASAEASFINGVDLYVDGGTIELSSLRVG